MSLSLGHRVAAAPRRAEGTAVRDGVAAVAASAPLCVWLAVAGSAMAVQGGAAAVAGIGIVGAAAGSVVARENRWSGPADRVTLARTVLIGGAATVAVLMLLGALDARTWWLVALAGPALLLDGVDGFVARRTGTASAAGARFDMEMDAALILIMSLAAVRPVGWWVLGIGLMRYAFVLGGRFRPRLRQPLAFSQFRRCVAAIQGGTLVVCLAPAVPLPLATAALATTLALLALSFGRDVVTLERTTVITLPDATARRAPGARR